jgi:prolyl 4-hydroxylase
MMAHQSQNQYHHHQQQSTSGAGCDVNPVTPVFNGVNILYPGLQQVHADPPVFAAHNFLTPQECQFLIDAASDSFSPAPVVGKGSGEVSPTRTSSTCYLAREDLPDLMRKVSMLTGKPMEHMELPQGT